MKQLLILSGSSRSGSLNSKLAACLAAAVIREGVEVQIVSLADYELPIYNGDLEQTHGLPDAAKRLKQLLLNSAGIVVACPEYNGFMTPLLLNAIDWCTRSEEGSGDLSAFADKPILVISASPGPGGGGRANTHLKTMLSGIGSFVFPATLTVPVAHKAFTKTGEFSDASMAQRSARLVTRFVQFTDRFENPAQSTT